MADEEVWDVAVVGGGVMGAAAAWHVSRAGRRTVLFERFDPIHNHGSSHGDGRIIRYSYAEPEYAAMAERSFHAWREVGVAAGETLVETTGGLDLAPKGSGMLAGLEASFARLGVAYECLDAAQIHNRFPVLRPPAATEGLFQPNGGVVRADRAVAAFWRLATAKGARLLPRTSIVDIDPDAHALDRTDAPAVRLTSADGGSWLARRVILTAGAWSGGLLAQLGLTLPLQVTQECLTYLPPRPGSPSHGIGGLPTIIDYQSDANPYYALPQVDIPGVKIGCHRSGPVIDPDTTRQPTPDLRDRIIAWATSNLPWVAPEPIVDLTCLYTNTADFDFIVDRLPDRPQVVIGAGFSGHGFKFAPVIGEMLAALALDAPDPVPRDRFLLRRFR